MPLHPEYLELTKGKFADLTNASDARVASSNYAAEFLRQFVGDVPWAHMDVAAAGNVRPYVGGCRLDPVRRAGEGQFAASRRLRGG